MKETREQILDCATDLYLEFGLVGVSMRKIASKVGITPMAIYRHFDDKDDLLEKMLLRGFRLFGSYLNRALEGKDEITRIHLTIDAYLAFATEKSKYFEIIFMATDSIRELKVREVIHKEAGATFSFLIARVQECIDAGCFKKEPAYPIAVTLLAEVNGLVALNLSNTFGWSQAEFTAIFKKSVERIVSLYMT